MNTRKLLACVVLILGLVVLNGCGGASPAPTAQHTPPSLTATPRPSSTPLTEFPLRPGGGPHSIVMGPDGNLWVTETFGNRIDRITPRGAITEFALPTPSSDPSGLAAGPDGNLWFIENRLNPQNGTDTAGYIGRITLTGMLTEFALPKAGPSRVVGITAGPDGNLWFTDINMSLIGRITPRGAITEFPLALPLYTPYAITAGPDGSVWFTDLLANRIGRITPKGTVTSFPVPLPTTEATGSIVAGPDGNVWFTEKDDNRIGRMTPAGTITEFALPTPASQPVGIVAGRDGTLWFTEPGVTRLGQITPAGVIKEFALPTSSRIAGSLTVGSDGTLWFLEFPEQIARFVPRT